MLQISVLTPEHTNWKEVLQRGSSAESRARTVYAELESNSEPERARVCQRVAVRASESQSGSHREPERATTQRASESLREPEWESQRAIESQRETGRDPVRARESQ